MTLRPVPRLRALPLLAVFVPAAAACDQQVADTTFRAVVGPPAFAEGAGPTVCVDGGHFNFHTIDGRYAPFAALLRGDGYVVTEVDAFFTPDALAACAVLVIANALDERNTDLPWTLPTYSAFSPEEITTVRAWVRDGGALLLIADHMPFAGGAIDLGGVFGVRFTNGFTFDSVPLGKGGYVFRRGDGSLATHPITAGRSAEERVDSVLGGIGSAFGAPEFEPLLTWRATATSRMADTAWVFPEGTPEITIEGWFQGAVREYGRGRVGAFGEGSSFTAQVRGPERDPMGMNHPLGAQNAQFALNVVHWLTRVGSEGEGSSPPR